MRRGNPLTLLALGTAFGLFAFTFRGDRRRFWERMTLTGFVLGNMALGNEAELRKMRPRRRDLAFGVGSAALLYAIFQIGDRMARAVMPRGESEIREIYGLRRLAPPDEIAFRLAAVIGPAEELFWRGLVQEALMRRLGRWRGAVAATLAYGGVHVVTGNFTLLGAATPLAVGQIRPLALPVLLPR